MAFQVGKAKRELQSAAQRALAIVGKPTSPAKRNLPFEGAATTLLGIYPKGLKTSVYPNTCTHILTSASLIVAKTWK